MIVGGGIVGCSVAYHLTKLGWSDVLLLERKQLTSGTTWHAAGLIGQLRATENLTRLAKYSAELYAGLEAETGQATGFRQHGSLGLARTAERFIELKRAASMGRTFGLEVEVLSPAEAKARHPLLEVEDLVGAIFIPSDGQANPIDLTQALAKGARTGGAQIVEGCAVTGITQAQRPGHRRGHRAGPGRGRGRGQLRRHVGPRGRAGWPASTCRSRRASISTC